MAERADMDQPPRLAVKVFADGADLEGIQRLAQNPIVSGFTTNPTLMRKAGVLNYEGFARTVLECVSDRPVCFEVFTDDFNEMRAQARYIGSWGSNVFIKIPVSNTLGESAMSVVRDLSADGLKV
ncbi:MAG TPA: transaldolase family protein, partial [Acidimicrobiales bacterium]|nr:transaldolase family protein [Acidimicrobiales bacterium]